MFSGCLSTVNGMTKICLLVLFASLLLTTIGCSRPTANAAPASTESSAVEAPSRDELADAKTDKFRFHYDVTITELAPGKMARVWLPVAQSNHDQQVKLVGEISVPGKHELRDETKFGNKLIYFEATANEKGEIPVKVSYEIRRRELTAESGEKVVEGQLKNFLAASRLVPVGDELLYRVVGDNRPVGAEKKVASELYNVVYDRMQYGKPKDKAWGRGDAVYACDEKVGNCTDFHSLFISMCRTLKLPAKFEIGFMIPAKGSEGTVGGYHCWAKFADEGRWVAVDISEADKDPSQKEYYFGNLTPNRVTFTTGRDLALQPAPANNAVNFLVYPYVEVDGKQHTGLSKNFRFEREN